MRSILVNLVVAASAVLFVCLFLLADIPLSLLVLTMVILVDVNVVGFLYVFGLNFNMVTAINLVIAVGLSVDGNAHVVKVCVLSTPGRCRYLWYSNL